MFKTSFIAAVALAGLTASAGAQTVEVSSAKDFMLLATGIEVAEALCDVIDIDGDELVEIGEAKHFFRGKAGITRVELAGARAAMEANVKKDKASFCGEIKKGYKEMYKALLDKSE